VVADKAGFAGKDIPWKNVTEYALVIYFCLTCLVCFHRPDFVNITASAVGAYIVHYPQICQWS